MRVVAYANGAGVAIVYPAPGFDAETVAAKDVPMGAPFVIMEAADLPDPATRDRWVWNNGVEVGPEVVRQTTEISFAQLIGGLVTEGWITKAEGQAWLRGTLPAPVETLIAELPEAAQIFAEGRAIRPSVVLLNDPLVQQLAAIRDKSAELPRFFNTYGAA